MLIFTRNAPLHLSTHTHIHEMLIYTTKFFANSKIHMTNSKINCSICHTRIGKSMLGCCGLLTSCKVAHTMISAFELLILLLFASVRWRACMCCGIDFICHPYGYDDANINNQAWYAQFYSNISTKIFSWVRCMSHFVVARNSMSWLSHVCHHS